MVEGVEGRHGTQKVSLVYNSTWSTYASSVSELMPPTELINPLG